MYIKKMIVYFIGVLLLPLLLSACSDSPSLQSAVKGKQSAQQADIVKRNIVLIAGKDSHGPDAHEHSAGTQFLANQLKQASPLINIQTVTNGWPEDESILNNADSVVVYCDGGPHHVMNDHLETVSKLLQKKAGFVFLHYGVEVPKESLSSKSMLAASGGYFETYWSVNPHWTASFEQLPKHPITRGVKPFKIKDEWYFNMRFQDNMKGVTPILTAIPPLSTIERENGPHSGNDTVRKMVINKQPQHVAWAYDRPDGGRGFGFTGGHFHKNWQHEDFKKIVLNAIVWTAQMDVPEQGVIVSN